MSKQENTTDSISRKFSVAPMMDWSDRHCRFLWRLISRKALLYTEMITAGALLHGDRERFLRYNPCEHPLAIQLGGSDAKELATCARLAESWGYDEVNLNCGCPSDRVQEGKIGACLMAEPKLVAEGVRAMMDAVGIPVTVKHRIGIDSMDDWQGLVDFVGPVAEAGCSTFIVHARKAWLQGLSPKQNREVPPLQYQRVYDLKQEFPHLEIILNGGITGMDDCLAHLQRVDGVMIGREAYSNPYLLAQVDNILYREEKKLPLARKEIVSAYAQYCKKEMESEGARLNHMSRHILGLYQGLPGARHFRRYISEHAHKAGASADILLEAVEAVEKVKQQRIKTTT